MNVHVKSLDAFVTKKLEKIKLTILSELIVTEWC